MSLVSHYRCVSCRVTDLHNNKRRLALSTTYKDIQTNPLHCKIPLGLLHRHGVGEQLNTWLVIVQVTLLQVVGL